jgi:nucleoside diphosphate kinase
MADQLAYVLINPYTIFKSRTGGVLARLFTRTSLDLVRARMFAPSAELVREFAEGISLDVPNKEERRIRELIRNYVIENYPPNPKTGRRRRVLMLVFRGEDAVQKIRRAAGPITHPDRVGETIRDTYGDYVIGRDGNVSYFEPAILVGQNPEETERDLKLWSRFADSDGGVMDGVVQHPPTAKVERTLVMLKPDNFKFPSSRPGNILDMFSRTGLYIVAVKVHRMTVAQAEEFYGPVKYTLREKLAPKAAERACAVLEKEFGFPVPESLKAQLASTIGITFADENFNRIVKFMTGISPDECKGDKNRERGTEKIVAVVYEGDHAVAKIREVLGPTDPSKAPPGTIRRELGQDIMSNAAHASDSAENAQREMRIINIAENNLSPYIEEFYGGQK